MPNKLTIDFETLSRENIRKRGLSRYVRSASTDVLCLAFSVNGSKKPGIWFPLIGEAAKQPNACVIPPCPPIITQAIEEGWEFHAHNAAFEIAIWLHVMHKRYGWPLVPAKAWRCTAAKAAYCNMPRALEDLSKRFDLGDQGKDAEGKKLMLLMSVPNKKTGNFNQDPEVFAKVRKYCQKDVISEEWIDEKLPEWQESELAIWQLDRVINDRGIPVDLKLCRGAMKIYARALLESSKTLAELTGGVVTKPTQGARIKKWISERGVNIKNMREETVKEILATPGIPDDVKTILKIRQQGNSAAVKKFQAAINFADDDSRARELLMYYGAGTGRWAGKAIQPHNFKRGKAAAETLCRAIATGDYDLFVTLYDPKDVINLLKSAVKSIIRAKAGRMLCISDFSGIEARVLQWFAGNEKALQMFRDGVDVYIVMACEIYGCRPEDIVVMDAKGEPILDHEGELQYHPGGKEKRQVGKVAVLGLGYGMGAIKFVASVKSMANIDISLELAQKVVAIYRQVNSAVVNLWKSVERAAVMAVRDKKTIGFGKLRFKCDGRYLKIQLPSGRWLHYYQPKVKCEDGLYGKNYRLSYLNKRTREDTYGGKLVENIVQAASRDLLCDAMLRVDAAGEEIIMHVHDEVVTECDASRVHEAKKILHEAMETVADWAKGCPVGAATHTSKRYTK